MLFKRLTMPASKFVRHQSIKAFLPNFQGVNGSTTLGEVYDRVYGKYRYRLIWPIVGWVGFLYYNLWIDYTPEKVKKAQLEKMKKMQALEAAAQ